MPLLRHPGTLLSVGLIALAGCGGAASTATTSTAATSMTVTTTSTTTTSTTLAGTVELPASTSMQLDIGAYAASGLWSPLTLTVEDPGWQSLGSTELWLYLRYIEPGRASFDLDVSILAHSPTGSVEAVATRIADSSDIEVTRPAGSTTLAGYPAMTLDVYSPESSFGGGYCGDPSTPGNSRFNDSAGAVLMIDADSPTTPYSFGVRLCRQARIWAVDVHGSTITIIAATTRPELFDDLIPVAERLLAGIAFGS